MRPIISLNAIDLCFKGAPQPLFQDFSLTIKPHEFVILLGSNGSGKSTLLKLMANRYRPTAGTIERPPLEKICFLTQSVHDTLFADFTVLENAAMHDLRYRNATLKSHPRHGDSALLKWLEDFHPQLPAHAHTHIKMLSGGEQQSLALALALQRAPELLLLDEHTSALDPQTSSSLMATTQQMIFAHQMTAVMTTHNIKYALMYGTRLIALRRGNIILDVQGEDKKALTQEALMKIYACEEDA